MCKLYCFMLPVVVIDPSETLILEQKDACPWMSITVLIIMATSITTKSKLPTTVDWLIKMRNIHSMCYYRAGEMGKLELPGGKLDQ